MVEPTPRQAARQGARGGAIGALLVAVLLTVLWAFTGDSTALIVAVLIIPAGALAAGMGGYISVPKTPRS